MVKSRKYIKYLIIILSILLMFGLVYKFINIREFNKSYSIANEMWSKGDFQGSLNYLKKLNNGSYEYAQALIILKNKKEEIDVNEMLSLLKESINKGYDKAIYKLGLMYYDGDILEKDYKKSAKYFTLSSDNGNVNSQYYLGLQYLFGEGVKHDKLKALSLFQQSSFGNQDSLFFDKYSSVIAGNINAQYLYSAVLDYDEHEDGKLGEYNDYFNGISNYNSYNNKYTLDDFINEYGIITDNSFSERAHISSYLSYNRKNDDGNSHQRKVKFNLYNLSFDDLFNSSNVRCHSAYFSGKRSYYIDVEEFNEKMTNFDLVVMSKCLIVEAKYFEEKYADAIKYLKLGSKRKDVKSSLLLGYLYLEGKGVTKNYKKAYSLIKFAADNNNIDAQRNLGYIYYKGLGVKKSQDKAVYWYTKAAENGDLISKRFIFNLYGLKDYMNSNNYSLPDLFDSTKSSIDSKYATLKDSRYNDRNSYIDAILSTYSRESNGLLNNYNILRSDYYKHIIYGDDTPEFIKDLEKESLNNSQEALISLAIVYYKGIGVDINLDKSLSYIKKASNLNNSSASLLLGYIYYDGGFNQDINKKTALRYFLKTINDNAPKDTFEYRDLYKVKANAYAHAGLIYSKYNKVKSYAYLSKSISMGVGMNKELTKLETTMSKYDIDKAQNIKL